MTFEDGRKGVIAARVAIRDIKLAARRADGEGGMRSPPAVHAGSEAAA